MEMEDFSASEDEDEGEDEGGDEGGSDDGEDDGDEGDEDVGDMGDSYISRDSIDEYDDEDGEDGEEYDDEEDDTADISNINDDADESDAPLLEDMPTPIRQGERDATPSAEAEAARSPSRGGFTEDPDADVISGMKGLMRQEESPHVEMRARMWR